MSVDEPKWLEIASKFAKNPRERETSDGGSSTSGTSKAAGSASSPPESMRARVITLETRLARMENLLVQKTHIIAQQQAAISELSHRLATTAAWDGLNEESVELVEGGRSGVIVGEPELSSTTKIDDPQLNPDGGGMAKETSNSNVSVHMKNMKKSRLPLRSSPDKNANQVPPDAFNHISERLESLAKRIDMLEMKLPGKNHTPCVELSTKREATSHARGCKGNCSTAVDHCRDCCDRNVRVMSSMCCWCDKLKPSINGNVNHRTQTKMFENLAWAKQPGIVPKSNMSAEYRLQHSMQKMKERDKNFVCHIDNSFSLKSFDEKLTNVENIVERFKEFLFRVLYGRLNN